MAPASGKCPVCGGTLQSVRPHGQRDIQLYSCDTCGEHWLTPEAIIWITSKDFGDVRRRKLVGQLRNAAKRDIRLEVSSYNAAELADTAVVPRSPLDVLDRLLLDLAAKASSFTQQLSVHSDEHFSYFLPSVRDLFGLLDSLVEEGFLSQSGRSSGDWKGSITLAGWRRVRELESRVPHSWQAFIAMSFAKEVHDAWHKGIKPALEETGYTPIRVDEVEHLGKIDDRIIAELKQCSLVVADFTLHRAGVYFEAGFAMGRGVPVIWTCREDDVANAHFDTRQYNHLSWSTPDELRTKLVNRIRATLPAKVAET